MHSCTGLIAALAAGAMSLGGQSLIVTSEFVRYRPDGAVVSADKIDKPRELLSPAVARNAHFTFRATVVFPKGDTPESSQPEGSPYTLHIAQNPEDSAEIRLFQEQYTSQGNEWIPDKLRHVEMPHGASLAKGQIAQSYLVDVFVPPKSTPNHRFRIEVQFYRGDGWMIYPMEIRVRHAAVDSAIETRGVLSALDLPLARAIDEPLRAYACAIKPTAPALSLDTGRSLLLRNVLEDLNLARQREKTDTREGAVFMLLKAAGMADLPAYCAGKMQLAGRGPEWWLKARDYLYQGRAVP